MVGTEENFEKELKGFVRGFNVLASEGKLESEERCEALHSQRPKQ